MMIVYIYISLCLDWPLEEVYEKHELEKEHERRRRKRTGESDDKGTYQEGNKDRSEVNMMSRRDRDRGKDGSDIDGRQKGKSHTDKHC